MDNKNSLTNFALPKYAVGNTAVKPSKNHKKHL